MTIRTEDFFNFIKERESIRLRKAAGLPFPWTEDPILREYKFTNVRRKHDFTTQKLIELFYSTHGLESEPEIVLLNCALFRYFGTWEFAQAVGWQTSFDPKHIIEIAANRLKKKQRVFTGAYIITNQGISAPKEEVVVNMFLGKLWQDSEKIIETMKQTNSWEKTASVLCKIQGFGGSGFMAKETLLDTMHCNFWQGGLPNDYDTWTPIGPGARRGLNRLREMPIDTPMNEQQMLSIIRELVSVQDSHWPSDWGKLVPTDFQFQLCEYDKMLRVRNGEGRPRSRYKPK